MYRVILYGPTSYSVCVTYIPSIDAVEERRGERKPVAVLQGWPTERKRERGKILRKLRDPVII